MPTTASPDPAADALLRPSAWEPAVHPKMAGFFCLARKRGDKTEHHLTDDSVAMYWSRGEAAAAVRSMPKE